MFGPPVQCGQIGRFGATLAPNWSTTGGRMAETLTETLRQRRGFTERREAFAQMVVALGNQSAAYRAVYTADNMDDLAVRVEASRVARVPYVYDRIVELREGVLGRSELQADDLVAMVQDCYEQAMDAKQYAAAKGAAELLVKITGIAPDKLDITSGGLPITGITRRIVHGTGNTDA